jgi:peptide/nickel transport system permease protein
MMTLVIGILLAALVGGLLIRTMLPPVKDARSYRRILSTETFQKRGFALLAPIPYGENENIIADARQAPTWRVAAADRTTRRWHWLGTDTNGRDVLARMIYGARVSIFIGVVAVGLYTLIGVVLGALAGYYGGWADLLISRLIEFVICFPVLMVILAVQAFLAPSLLNLVLALALMWWTGVARLQRAEFLRLVNLDFVQSVRALGGSDFRIIALHMLPNGLAPILVMISFGVAGSIVVESALSYLGFGVPQPMASWGDLLNNGRNDVRGLWWLTIFPGLAIFVTVTCFNLVGEAVRDALDPKRTP